MIDWLADNLVLLTLLWVIISGVSYICDVLKDILFHQQGIINHLIEIKQDQQRWHGDNDDNTV